LLDRLGFDFRSGEPEQDIVSLCRVRHKSANRTGRAPR
jgi:hypothetical protein